MAVGKNIAWKKRERGSNITFSIIFGLFGRISSWEKRKGTEISGKKIFLKKNRGGDDIKL